MRYLHLLFICAIPAFAEVRLPALVSDHMVIQSGVPVRVWGWAAAGEAVTVKFRGQQAAAIASTEGKWEASLRPTLAGGPFEMAIEGSNTIQIKDVLVGEVWVASGQSNMAFTMKRIKGAQDLLATAANSKIRLFNVARKSSGAPDDDVKGEWQVASAESAENFSAVAYLFGRDLEGSMKVPFGMINSSVGGTPVEAWISGPSLTGDPSLLPAMTRWQKLMLDYPLLARRHEAAVKKWEAAGKQGRRPAEPVGPGHNHEPIRLYNGMIAPLTPYTIRGALWYQGENNAGRGDGDLYRRLLETLIHDWRQQWGVGNFPFLWVQLPHFVRRDGDEGWPEVQEAMRNTLEIANTGMAITQDVGEANDIHPTDKLPVAKRLALAARKVAYGQDVLASGPIFRQATREGKALRLWFDYPGEGLRTAKGEPIEGLLVAGKNGQYKAAEAKIEGDSIVVSNGEVGYPVSVRYAWGGTVVGNLVNSIAIPASPFRVNAP